MHKKSLITKLSIQKVNTKCNLSTLGDVVDIVLILIYPEVSFETVDGLRAGDWRFDRGWHVDKCI